eukprot:9492155-Pyramimonas_sp.AAC.1
MSSHRRLVGVSLTVRRPRCCFPPLLQERLLSPTHGDDCEAMANSEEEEEVEEDNNNKDKVAEWDGDNDSDSAGGG